MPRIRQELIDLLKEENNHKLLKRLIAAATNCADSTCKTLFSTSSLEHILLVEDDPRDAELILESLAEYNLANEVIVAIDGEEALDYLYSRGKFKARPSDNPALVVLDLNVPKVSGMEVLKQVRSDEKLKILAL